MRAHHDNEPTQHPAEPLFRQAAVVVLGAIGVSGRPLDPATDFEDITCAGLNVAWLSGAVYPISMRGLVGLLIVALPKETLKDVGQKLLEASHDDEDGEFSKIDASTELMRAPKAGT